jgi:elongation factor G
MSESNPASRAILSLSFRPTSDDNQQRIGDVLNLLSQDPSNQIETASVDGETSIRGMSESQLKRICNRVVHDYGIQLDVDEPKVIYLETICKKAEAEGKYIRQTGGSGNYGHCKLRVEPKTAGAGYEFINDIKGGVVPMEYIKPIDQGVEGALELGILAGYPLVDIKVTLFDGSYHEVYSNEMAFKFAGSTAFKEAARKASPVVLEPMMAVEVAVPEELMGVIISDINSRRGRIESMENEADSQVIKAMVPLAETLGYENDIRLLTRGRANQSMHFAKYEPTPHRGGHDGDGAGVTANKPEGPKAGTGFIAARLDPEPE